LKNNKLKLNVNKTKVMLVRGIRKKVSESKMKVKLENIALKIVSEIKYLGVIIDRNLNFATHVNYLEKKIGSKLGTFCPISMNLTLYMRCIQSIIASLFEYCSSILFSLNDYNVQYL